MAEENDKQSTEQTFTFSPGKESGEASPGYLLQQRGGTSQVTVDDLRDYFDAEENDKLRAQFGSFDNYLGYMTEREQLIQENSEFAGDWANADAALTEDQKMIFEGDADLSIDASDPNQNIVNVNRQVSNAQSAGYENWLARNEELLNKYGASGVLKTETGTTYKWNGSGYVKTQKDSDDLKNYAKLAMGIGMGAVLGPGITKELGGGMLAGAAGGVASGAVTQLVTTGSINPEDLLVNAISGAFTGLADMDLANASDFERAVDNALWDFSDVLGVDYETANRIARSVASGVAEGRDIGDIASSVVGDYGADVIMGNVNLGVGDVTVQNAFRDGQSIISSEAIEGVIGNAVEGAIKGKQDPVGMLRDFAQDGGLDFLRPGNLGGFGQTVQTPQWIRDLAQNAEDFYQEDIRPLLRPVEEAGRLFDQQVTQPIGQALSEAETAVRRSLPNISLDTPEMPSLDMEGPDLDLDFDLNFGGQSRGMFTDFDPFNRDIGYEKVIRPELVLSPTSLFRGMA